MKINMKSLASAGDKQQHNKTRGTYFRKWWIRLKFG